MIWNGVMPAITTWFDSDYAVDHKSMADHCRWLLDKGCTGLVPLCSLGEGATLSFGEKLDVIKTCVKAAQGKAPVMGAISSLKTSEAVDLAKGAADAGCDALMVLPPYVYQGDWREMRSEE